jgi:hypothetical protein
VVECGRRVRALERAEREREGREGGREGSSRVGELRERESVCPALSTSTCPCVYEVPDSIAKKKKRRKQKRKREKAL